VPAGLLAAVIFAASSLPSTSWGGSSLWQFDKLVHAAEYALLAFLCVHALWRGPWQPGRGRGLAGELYVLTVGAGLAALYGVSDEWHQSFTPGRTSSRLDMLADWIGAAIGALSYTAARRLHRSEHGPRA
jgi:VanZ family protein